MQNLLYLTNSTNEIKVYLQNIEKLEVLWMIL
jgi:hypothetical protein